MPSGRNQKGIGIEIATCICGNKNNYPEREEKGHTLPWKHKSREQVQNGEKEKRGGSEQRDMPRKAVVLFYIMSL